jgi:hypothetical protein
LQLSDAAVLLFKYGGSGTENWVVFLCLMSVVAYFLVAGWRKADVVCVRARIVVSSVSVVSLVVSAWLVSVKGGAGRESVGGNFVSFFLIVLIEMSVIGVVRIPSVVEV